MTARDKYEREQDRADLLAVLEEADGPLRTDTLIARANGMHDPSLTDTSWWRHYSRGMADLRALVKVGRVLQLHDPTVRYARWMIPTEAEVDAVSDQGEVARMAARWEPDEQANRPRPQTRDEVTPGDEVRDEVTRRPPPRPKPGTTSPGATGEKRRSHGQIDLVPTSSPTSSPPRPRGAQGTRESDLVPESPPLMGGRGHGALSGRPRATATESRPEDAQ